MRVEGHTEEPLWQRWTFARVLIVFVWLVATFLHLAWHSFVGGFMTAFWPDRDSLNYAAVEIAIGFLPLLLALIGIGVARRRRWWLVSAGIVAVMGIWFVTDILTSYAHPDDGLPQLTILDRSAFEVVTAGVVVVGSVLGLAMIIVKSRSARRRRSTEAHEH